jgi:hypothetical protein
MQADAKWARALQAKLPRLPDRAHRRGPGDEPALAVLEIAFEVGDRATPADHAGVGAETAVHDRQKVAQLGPQAPFKVNASDPMPLTLKNF